MGIKNKFAVAVSAFVLSLMVVAPAMATNHLLPPFTQDELNDNWEADRAFPTGGVVSVSEFGRDDVARIGVDSEETAIGTFQRTEGIKTVGVQDFGTTVQVDLYIDPDWEDKAVRAGFWVVGDNGSGGRDNLFGIIEFVNNEECPELECSNQGNITDHEGFRIWSSDIGWKPNLETSFNYGEWVTLGIELDPLGEQYAYYINGEQVGTAVGGVHSIGELFLNSYNYGNDNFPTLSEESYSAHWHSGIEMTAPTNKDECKKGGWESFSSLEFKNQGDCVSFVASNGKAGGNPVLGFLRNLFN